MRKLLGRIIFFGVVVRAVFRSLRVYVDKTIAEIRELEALARGKTPPAPKSWPTESTPYLKEALDREDDHIAIAKGSADGKSEQPVTVGEFSEHRVWLRSYEAALAAGSTCPEMRADEFGRRFGRFLSADQVGTAA